MPFESILKMGVVPSSIKYGICKINKYDYSDVEMDDGFRELVNANDKNKKKHFLDFFKKEDVNKLMIKLQDINEKDEAIECELRILKEKEIRWVNVILKIKENFILCLIFDIDEKKKIEIEMKMLKERNKILEESVEGIIFDYDVITDTLLISNAPSEYSINNTVINNYIKRKKYEKHFHADDIDLFNKKFENGLLSENVGYGEYRIKINRSDYHWFLLKYSSLIDADGKVVCIIGRLKDINEDRLEYYKKEDNDVESDPMTGILNKTAIKYSIDTFLNNFKNNSKEISHAMVSIDIDNFQKINEVYGKTFCDMVIENVSATIKSTINDCDFVGRIGIDNFLVFLKNVSSEIAEKKANEIKNAINKNYFGDNTKIEVSCSIGISYYNKDGEDFETLFSCADAAMCNAKFIGKNKLCSYGKNMKKRNNYENVNILNDMDFHLNFNNYDVKFITFSFSLLSNSKELNSSINLLLERTGIRYGIKMVSIFENRTSNSVNTRINQWEKNIGITDKSDDAAYSQQWYNIFLKVSKNGIIFINNYNIDKLDEKERSFLKENNITSVIGFMLYDDNALESISIFCDNNKIRQWTTYEKNTFFELSKILSVFVALRKERNKERDKFNKLVTTDGLTGLYNIETFKKIASSRILENRNKINAIIALDINNFSYVNENFGYSAGDRMLCNLAVQLDEIPDSIACRVYCDYFLVLLSGKSKDFILKLIKKNQLDFIESQKQMYPASDLRISTGVYFIEDRNCDITIAIENANLIRKSIKSNNDIVCGVYTEDLRIKRNYEQSLVGEIHRAIELGELKLFLQPKFSLKDRSIVGAEALVRWRNIDGSYKYPADFIFVLERVGYVVELDYYMYEQVLKSLRKWIDEEKTYFPISVNFSRLHTNYDDFSERVYDLALKYNINPQLIEIEITEGTLASDTGKMIRHMSKLQKLGFKMDIDDFGTGYSSLSLLLTAPVDIVKIDKSFLNSRGNTEREIKYVKQLINLVYAAEKEIVFEGVETEEQASFIYSCGVKMAQGFLFDRAIPLDEFENKYIDNKN